jgi:hypothetical protein
MAIDEIRIQAADKAGDAALSAISTARIRLDAMGLIVAGRLPSSGG